MLKAEVSVAAGEALHFADFGYLLGNAGKMQNVISVTCFFLNQGKKSCLLTVQ